jgi:hypothetical protein
VAISGNQMAQLTARSGVLRSGTGRSSATFVHWVRSLACAIVSVWVADKH